MKLEEGQQTGENLRCFKCKKEIVTGEKYVFIRLNYLAGYVVAFFPVHEDEFIEALKNYRPPALLAGGPK